MLKCLSSVLVSSMDFPLNWYIIQIMKPQTQMATHFALGQPPDHQREENRKSTEMYEVFKMLKSKNIGRVI